MDRRLYQTGLEGEEVKPTRGTAGLIFLVVEYVADFVESPVFGRRLYRGHDFRDRDELMLHTDVIAGELSKSDVQRIDSSTSLKDIRKFHNVHLTYIL